MKKSCKKQYIVVTHIIKKENEQYVATCPEFDVSSFGDTVEEANNSLREAILLYLEGIESLNILDQIFKEKAIVTYERKPKSVTSDYRFADDLDGQPFVTKKSLNVALCNS